MWKWIIGNEITFADGHQIVGIRLHCWFNWWWHLLLHSRPFPGQPSFSSWSSAWTLHIIRPSVAVTNIYIGVLLSTGLAHVLSRSRDDVGVCVWMILCNRKQRVKVVEHSESILLFPSHGDVASMNVLIFSENLIDKLSSSSPLSTSACVDGTNMPLRRT